MARPRPPRRRSRRAMAGPIAGFNLIAADGGSDFLRGDGHGAIVARALSPGPAYGHGDGPRRPGLAAHGATSAAFRRRGCRRVRRRMTRPGGPALLADRSGPPCRQRAERAAARRVGTRAPRLRGCRRMARRGGCSRRPPRHRAGFTRILRSGGARGGLSAAHGVLMSASWRSAVV